MRTLLRRLPLPYLSYLFVLLGFLGLGLFVAALGFGVAQAPLFAVAMVVAFGMAVACVLLRRYQIAHADPESSEVLGLDPLRGDVDRSAAARYLLVYRGQDIDEVPVDERPTMNVEKPRSGLSAKSSGARRAALHA
jgi:hypothetical protein